MLSSTSPSDPHRSHNRFLPITLLLAVVLSFFIADRILASGLERIFRQSEFRYSRLYRGGMKNDVVILGNSRGRAYYVPYLESRLGVSCFNLSYDSMDMETSALLFADYLDHNAAPNLLIVELSCLQEDSSIHAGSIKVFFPQSQRFRDFLHTNEPINWELCRFVHSYRYNSEFFLRALSNRSGDQGWVNTGVISQAVLDEIAQGYAIQDDSPPSDRYSALRGLLQLAGDRGIQVQLVLNPYYPGYAKPGLLIPYERHVREYTGIDIKVWDYRLSLTDSSDFSDSRHINVDGSRELINRQIDDGLYAPLGTEFQASREKHPPASDSANPSHWQSTRID